MAISEKERISEAPWDGSAGRFTDEQYQRSCVLDRKVCGGEWASAPPKTRCSLPIREPGGQLSRGGVHAAASRINQVSGACAQAIATAKSKLRGAYKQLGEQPPDSLTPSSSSKSENENGNGTVHRDRALASLDHEWEFRDQAPEPGYLGTLFGHFAVFDRWTEINSLFEGHFMERVAPGAFTKTFAENRKGMRCLFNHGKDPSIGLKPLGPIRDLSQDDTGAFYEVGLLDTGYNRDLVPGLKEGQFGASFRFAVMREEFVNNPPRGDHNPDGIPESTIKEAKVREFGPVTFGQYEEATSGLRSLNDELVGMDLSLMARSDPRVVADFARILSVSVPEVPRGANVGTSDEDEERDENGGRNAPTSVDDGILSSLKGIKSSLEDVMATQKRDPDMGDDSDDDDVMSALEEASSAIDDAIDAQTDDCADESDGMDDDSDDDSSESSNSQDTSPDESTRAPADGAPVHGPSPMGATLKKRAAPLRTQRTAGEPIWKL